MSTQGPPADIGTTSSPKALLRPLVAALKNALDPAQALSPGRYSFGHPERGIPPRGLPTTLIPSRLAIERPLPRSSAPRHPSPGAHPAHLRPDSSFQARTLQKN